MRNLYFSLLIFLVFYASNVFAQSESEAYLETYLPETEEIVPATEIPVPQEADTQTRLWLKLQESGAMGSSNPQPIPGQAATLIYQRYLDSFSHPIPEKFQNDGMGSDSSSGSSSRR